MDIEVNRLVAIIHKKNGDLTELETKLVKRLRWGIVVLQTKNENIVRRQVLQWWRCVKLLGQLCIIAAGSTATTYKLLAAPIIPCSDSHHC